MQPPDALLQRGVQSLPTLGDGRQSGTSDSPSILNASPESANGGGLAWLRTGDTIRIDLNTGTCNALVSDEEIARRKSELPTPAPKSITPWRNSTARKPGSSRRARSSSSPSNIAERQRRHRGTITERAAQIPAQEACLRHRDLRPDSPPMHTEPEQLADHRSRSPPSCPELEHRRSGSLRPARHIARTHWHLFRSELAAAWRR